ncbi:ACT domain-containing protein ACR4 [Ananas comosus]|uniref:ACT domain-containing protein ACR n=1 Tax=Ananas comosus TaxID=4615 RepID=A0A199W9Z8_ANACO|nr:ACT domain-containing protein ACR4 [Ananas comosus]
MMGCGSPHTEVEDEYEKLVIKMNPPRVTVDNTSDMAATLVKVDSVNKFGSLLEVVQVLTDLKLTIRRAYISSDGEWFMDVFHVVDKEGNKIYDGEVIDRIEESLGAKSFSLRSATRSVSIQATAEYTCIELLGQDRPGLLSEIFAVLVNLECNVVGAEVWTHSLRMASVIYLTDESTGTPIEDPDRLNTMKRLLRFVLKGSGDKRSTARTAISEEVTHIERRLHQLMCADRDCALGGSKCSDEEEAEQSETNKTVVTVESCVEKGYTVVNVRCNDRPKLLFDAVCTLTDMEYVVFHGTVIAKGPEAYQEFYIRHLDESPIISEAEGRRLVHSLEAAIERRNTEGIRLELCCEDRFGLLSDVTRIFRENGLSVTHAEVSTRGAQAVNVFYVMDATGGPVESQTIEAVRNKIGEKILHVRDDLKSKSPTKDSGSSSFGNMIRSRSEKFLYNLGLIRSCS